MGDSIDSCLSDCVMVLLVREKVRLYPFTKDNSVSAVTLVTRTDLVEEFVGPEVDVRVLVQIVDPVDGIPGMGCRWHLAS